ncbi:MAG: hydrogenase maturation nickel metallochaperone HypA [Acidobacteriaceae bacterium]
MHELSLALSIIEGVEAEAAERGGLRVEVVHLKLGPLAGVDKDALLFSYEIACAGTTLAGSRLDIEDVPLLIYCPQCRSEHTPLSIHRLYCPTCLLPPQEVRTGKELEVTTLEVAV